MFFLNVHDSYRYVTLQFQYLLHVHPATIWTESWQFNVEDPATQYAFFRRTLSGKIKQLWLACSYPFTQGMRCSIQLLNTEEFNYEKDFINQDTEKAHDKLLTILLPGWSSSYCFNDHL